MSENKVKEATDKMKELFDKIVPLFNEYDPAHQVYVAANIVGNLAAQAAKPEEALGRLMIIIVHLFNKSRDLEPETDEE